MVGGIGRDFFYSARKKARFSGDGTEESDLFGGGFAGAGAEEVGVSARVFASGSDGRGAAEGGGHGGGASPGVGAFGRKCSSAGFRFMSEGLWQRQGGDCFPVIGRSKVGESLENR